MANIPENAPLAGSDVTGSEEVLVAPATPRRGSNSHALKVAGLTTLACLLVGSQVFAMYMVFEQTNQISVIKTNSEQLRRQLNRPAASVESSMKVHAPMNNQILLAQFPSEDLKKTNEKLTAVKTTKTTTAAETTKTTRTTKAPMTILKDTILSLAKQLKDLPLDSQQPPFNKPNLASLQGLKSQMEEKERLSLELWMHYWLITRTEQPQNQYSTLAPTASAPLIKTKCQTEAAHGTGRYGSFRPQCDEHGKYSHIQCWDSTGHCWCVDETGKVIEGTVTRGRPNCTEVLEQK
ncbi:CD74 molecule, major histocompatibility complex, class II invariant chain a [Antennarius striatus]|uniref:CD74 molecule, major histocompatibility complex, class II invariant chain a n=1 Tax=Antennarius striatus TaxID=241820 RepID=UPI0035AF4DEC